MRESAAKHKDKRFFFSPLDITKAHWKAQAAVHFTIGLPLALLACVSWGLQGPALFRVMIAYLGLYAFVYFPLYRLWPYIFLRPVLPLVTKLNKNEKLTDQEVVRIVSFLINYPLPTAIKTAFIEMSAFGFGAIVWRSGLIVPELLPILDIVMLETAILGLVVAINVSFLNLVTLDGIMGNVVEKILSRYPLVAESDMPIRRISMFTKVFFLILLTTIAGEISILIFFTTYLLSLDPSKMAENSVYIIAVMAINIAYVFILAPIVSRNFTTPMQKLVEWINQIKKGNMQSRIKFVTNDETSDIINGSNLMIHRLDVATHELTSSMQKLQEDRDVIKTERNKLSTVLFGVIDGVIALDVNKNIVLLNKAAEDMLGWRESEVLGRPIDSVFHLFDQNEEPVISNNFCPDAVTMQNVTQRYSQNHLKLKTKNDTDKYINLTCATIAPQHETESSYILTFHDITEELELEEMKLDFVSMAAHELRTPLTAILGYMSMYINENQSKMDDSQSMMLNRVFYSAQQLTGLVENLLNVSKIERGSLTLAFQPIDWIQKIQDVVGSLSYLAQEKNIVLQFNHPDQSTLVIDVDNIRITEVLNNLIANAINYTNAGGSITIWIEDQGENILTHVHDTGIGIPTKAIRHLFTKFFRVTGKLGDGSKGTGLGLYLSKAIVEMHHGTISVKSTINVGSTFSFTLPKRQPNTNNHGEKNSSH